jgi:hypothetical protein
MPEGEPPERAAPAAAILVNGLKSSRRGTDKVESVRSLRSSGD